MKHKMLISTVLISLILAVVLSGCGLFQKPKQEPAPPEDEQAAYWENPWENLPVVSRDGSGTVGADGGIVWLGDTVAVKIPKDLFDEWGEVEVGVRIEDFDPSSVSLGAAEAQDTAAWSWDNQQIVITISKHIEDIIIGIAERITNKINNISKNKILDILVSENGKTFYAAASYTSLENIGFQVAVPVQSKNMLSTVYYFVFRTTPVDEVQNRCESAGGRFIYGDALPFAPPPGEAINYVCVPPLGKAWNRITQSMVPKNRWNPAAYRDFTLLTANVGSFFGQYSLRGYKFKLSYASAAQRIANNISIIQPDLVLFQEVFHESQISSLIDLATYSYSCARYPDGSSHECIAWKKDLAGSVASSIKTVVGKPVPGESSFLVFCEDEDDEDNCKPRFFDIDYCTSNSSEKNKDTGAHLISLNLGEHVLQVASVHTATAGIKDAKYCREQQLLTLLIDSEVARFVGGRWSSTYNSPPTLFAGDYNIDPQRGGAGIAKTSDDMYRLRWLVDWSLIDSSFDEPLGGLVGHPLVEPRVGFDVLYPWRDENNPTAFPSKQSFDHVLSLPGFFSGQICEVLDDEHRLDANYWWAYNSTEHTYGFGGMDHRAVLCGFDFAPYFDANLSSSSLEVPQGGSATVQLYITPKAGFSGDINVRLVNRADGETTPAGIEISPPTIPADALSTSKHELTITASSTAAPASYDLELLLSAGSVVRSVSLGVDLIPSSPLDPSFTLSLSPAELTVAQGQSAETTLTVTPENGFTGDVSLSLTRQDGSAAPVGITIAPTQVTVPGSDPISRTLTIFPDSSVPAGTYNLRLLGRSGELSAGADFVLTVEEDGSGTGGGDGTEWTLRSAPLLGVAYGNGLCVAVGNGGTILTSPDGASWTLRNSGTGKDLYGVAYGNGLFVAVGEGGIILTSPDGVSWTAQSSGMGNGLLGVAYGNGLFVAVGRYGTILTSPDGASWTAQSSGTSAWLLSVAYGNGLFVAVDWLGTIVTSPDGVSWTLQTSGTSAWLRGVTYGDDTFVAVGNGGTILTSPDGESWTAQRSGTGNDLYGVAYGNGLFVAVGSGATILTSPDGASWTLRNSGTGSALYGVAYGNGLFVAVGSGDTILTSPDGVSWTVQSSGTGNNLLGVAYGNGLFVAVGSGGTILTSPDGESWTLRNSGTGSALYGVAYGNGTFVAVGSGGTIFTSP